MPIEFACSGCQKLLRVPDDAAGKSAKCPQCGNVLPVPAASIPQLTPSAQPLAPPPPNPTVGASPFGSPSSIPHDTNPYASPAGPLLSGATYARDEIRLSRLDIGQVINASWTILKRDLGICILALFITGAVNMGFSMLSNVGQVVITIAQSDVGRIVGGLLIVITQLTGIVVQTWLNLGMIRFNIRLARGQGAEITEIFRGGPALLSTLLVSLLAILVFAVATAICLGPAWVTEYWLIVGVPVLIALSIYLGLRYCMYMFLIVDRGLPAIDSLTMSSRITQGNRGAIFVLGLVSGGIVLLGVLACFVGLFVAIPLVTLMQSVTYLHLTGERTMGDA